MWIVNWFCWSFSRIILLSKSFDEVVTHNVQGIEYHEEEISGEVIEVNYQHDLSQHLYSNNFGNCNPLYTIRIYHKLCFWYILANTTPTYSSSWSIFLQIWNSIQDGSLDLGLEFEMPSPSMLIPSPQEIRQQPIDENQVTLNYFNCFITDQLIKYITNY